jgi:quercetin dioxygenase-like cupin family protein
MEDLMPETTNMPTGTYPHSTSVHHLDLDAIADRLLAGLNGAGRNSENIARESGVSLVLMALAEGDTLDEHAAPGVVTVQVLRGALRLEAAGKTEVLESGHLVLLQASVPHRHTAEERSVVLLTVTGATP